MLLVLRASLIDPKWAELLAWPAQPSLDGFVTLCQISLTEGGEVITRETPTLPVPKKRKQAQMMVFFLPQN